MITNLNDIPLAMAVWLVNDDYDYQNIPNYQSATSLLVPTKQLVLGSRVSLEDRTEDVLDFVPRALGNSIHDSVEKAWVKNYRKNLTKLGVPEKIIDRIKINPEDDELEDGDIPVYIEQRMFVEFAGKTLGGKYDMVTEGILNDTKSTSAYSWVYDSNTEQHRLQGSIYRWMDHKQKGPNRITSDFIRINYVFTDWSKAQTSNPNYPDQRTKYKDIPLLSLAETEAYILSKIKQIDKYKESPEEDIPECTDEELWKTDNKYKYFSDPTKTSGRSTRTFTTLKEANDFLATKGKGVVITEHGEVKRCNYCNAAPICEQRKRYFDD